MTRYVRKPSKADIYHVVVRGVGRQIIFEDARDKKHFIEILEETLDKYNAALWAYCLMDNHVHLLLNVPFADLSTFMQKLQTNYARYFNKRHSREGTLFQGRFFSEPVQTDEQLAAVVRYIHYNPVKAGGKLQNAWSSYKEYLGEDGLCSVKKPLSMLGGKKGFEQFHTTDNFGQAPKLPKTHIDDPDALSIAQAALGKENIHDVKSFSKEKRDAVLCTLKEAGLSVRQISMLTGIGHNIIFRAKR